MMQHMPTAEPNSTNWRNANQATHGHLEEIIRQARDDDESWRRLSVRLSLEYGVEVSDQTLIKWARHLGIRTSRAVAA